MNQRGPNGPTALMIAVLEAEDETVKWLLQNGADKTLTSTNGRTALSLAQSMKRKNVVKMLNQAGI